MDEELKEVAFIVVAWLVFMAVIFGIGYGIKLYNCSAYQEATGRETKVIAMTCYVKDKGAWYAWSEYKLRLVATGNM